MKHVIWAYVVGKTVVRMGRRKNRGDEWVMMVVRIGDELPCALL